jgi:dTDP-4-dehydrorhamnose 3,5-epimerase
MIFNKTTLSGVLEIDIKPNVDDRGFFARTWCQREFEEHGLNSKLAQCSISFNERKGTLRGVHYQADPYPEAKLVRCTEGAIYELVVDLRPHSSTYKKWISLTLDAKKHNMVYVPEGCAHGFLTLADKTEVLYQISEFYHPDLGRGIRWNDPAFQFVWPQKIEVISERDRSFPDFVEA